MIEENFRLKSNLKASYFWVGCFLAGIVACSPINTQSISSVRYVYQVPISYDNKGEVYYLADTILIFYKNNFRLYQLPPTSDFITGKNIDGTQYYFGHLVDSRYGYLFASINDPVSFTRVSADSFIKEKLAFGKDFDTPPDTIWSLVRKLENKNSLTESFALALPDKHEYFDSITYFYEKKFPEVGFSFSKKLEEEKNMKLTNVVFVYKEKIDDSGKLFPKREFRFMINNYNPPNLVKICEIFERIEKFEKSR